MKKIAVAVINDLSTDQRVRKTCTSLLKLHWQPVLIGRKLPKSKAISRPYRIIRMQCFINQGPFFYAIYNIQLFVRLLFLKLEAIWANDLDTMLACSMAAKFKSVPLIYDSHEFFTEVPEISHKPIVKWVWKTIEKITLPKANHLITVSDGIANLFEQNYGRHPVVMRNIPEQKKQQITHSLTRKELGIPDNHLLLILQGSGINIDRGAEELIEAMAVLKNVSLLIVGDGDVLPFLKSRVVELNLTHVKMLPKQPYEQLMRYTQLADVGLTLDKSSNLNYRYSLPNKLFDYIGAHTPVISSPLPEVNKIIAQYDVGWVLKAHSVEAIVNQVGEIKNNPEALLEKVEKCKHASKHLSWEQEAICIQQIIHEIER